MKEVKMWWKVNYGKEEISLGLPDAWKTNVIRMKPAATLTDEQIAARITDPIGSPQLRDMVKGKKTVCIAIDDLARPTESARICPHLVTELKKGGIHPDDIYFIVGMGTHRQYTISELAVKLGWDIVKNHRVYNHNPYQNNKLIGKTTRGTPLHINALFMEADFKIGVGGLMPHPLAGYGGGGKIVLPGLASIECVELTLAATLRGIQGRIGRTEGNQVRADINEAAKICGLNFIVNTVSNERGETCGVFAGDSDAAFDAAVPLAQEIYGCDVPYNNDIGIFNAFPKDIWFLLSLGSMTAWSTRDADKQVVREGGTVVIINHASEGQGEHGLMTRGNKQYVYRDQHGTFKGMLQNRNIIFYSPNITRLMIKDYYKADAALFDKWPDLVKKLEALHPGSPKVAVFPNGASQLDKTVIKKEELVIGSSQPG